jgi:endonuclease/exonuclease/phosphatase family metal-dependent hydrolase
MKVKLMTLNINHGGELIENICDFIEAEQPDILLIQEAYNGINPKLEQRFRSMDILARSMNATQTFFTSAYMDGDVDIDRGNGIISKFPIIASEGTIFNSAYRTIHNESNLGDWSDQPRVIQVCEIAVEGKHINIANVHGIWDFHGRDSDKRIEQAQLILEQIQHKRSVILAGDFNMNPDTKAISLISESIPLIFGNDLKTTFNMSRKSNPDFGNAVVDMVFASPDIKITSTKCPNVDVSDHLPLIVEFEI